MSHGWQITRLRIGRGWVPMKSHVKDYVVSMTIATFFLSSLATAETIRVGVNTGDFKPYRLTEAGKLAGGDIEILRTAARSRSYENPGSVYSKMSKMGCWMQHYPAIGRRRQTSSPFLPTFRCISLGILCLHSRNQVSYAASSVIWPV